MVFDWPEGPFPFLHDFLFIVPLHVREPCDRWDSSLLSGSLHLGSLLPCRCNVGLSPALALSDRRRLPWRDQKEDKMSPNLAPEEPGSLLAPGG